MLRETAKNPSGFIPLKRAVCLKLMLEDPFSRNNIGPRRTRKKILGEVLEKGSVFFLHGGPPVGVGKTTTDGLRHR